MMILSGSEFRKYGKQIFESKQGRHCLRDVGCDKRKPGCGGESRNHNYFAALNQAWKIY